MTSGQRDGELDLHSLQTDLQRTYWGLREAARALDRQFVTAAEVSDCLAEIGRVAVSRQKVSCLLDAAGTSVKRKRENGKRVYQLMNLGEDSISSSSTEAVLIGPENGFSEIRKFEAILNSLSGAVRICDPYFESRSLDFVAEITAASSIHILTHNLYGERKFRRDFDALRRQVSVPLELRLTQLADNHDRYILSDSSSFLIGGSLNGFAKKRMFLTPLSKRLATSTKRIFDNDWKSAKRF